jgi:hypothetical protein
LENLIAINKINDLILYKGKNNILESKV